MAQPSPAMAAGPVTIVTQTRVRPEHAADFAQWQHTVSDAIGKAPGFVEQEVLPPAPSQPDWVILQRFTDRETARAWLGSPARAGLLARAAGWFVGTDDVHLVDSDDATSPAGVAPIAAVIATQVKPGQEAAFQAWQHRVAAIEAQFPGYQGYKLTPPVPGVQTDWLTILRFDTEEHLNGWLSSPQRQALLAEGNALSMESHLRTVRTGFDAWFKLGSGVTPPPAWKQNMLVLVALYPVVFLFGHFVQTPLLMERLGLGFSTALFVGNVAGVLLLGVIVPRISNIFTWWLNPGSPPERTNLVGAGAIVVVYLLWLVLFARFP